MLVFSAICLCCSRFHGRVMSCPSSRTPVGQRLCEFLDPQRLPSTFACEHPQLVDANLFDTGVDLSRLFLVDLSYLFFFIFSTHYYYTTFPLFSTLPETNIAPENRPSQKETSIPTIHFSGAMLVSGRVLFPTSTSTLHFFCLLLPILNWQTCLFWLISSFHSLEAMRKGEF